MTAYQKVHSSNIEEAREGIAQAMDPHRMDPLPHRVVTGPTVLNAVEIGSLGVCYLAHGVPVRVRCGGASEPTRPYLTAMLPLAGRVTVQNGRKEIFADRQTPSILDCDSDVDMVFEPGTELVVLRLDRTALEGQLAKMLGRPLVTQLHVHTDLDIDAPAIQSWLSTVRMLCSDLDGPGGLRHAALQRPTE